MNRAKLQRRSEMARLIAARWHAKRTATGRVQSRVPNVAAPARWGEESLLNTPIAVPVIKKYRVMDDDVFVDFYDTREEAREGKRRAYSKGVGPFVIEKWDSGKGSYVVVR